MANSYHTQTIAASQATNTTYTYVNHKKKTGHHLVLNGLDKTIKLQNQLNYVL